MQLVPGKGAAQIRLQLEAARADRLEGWPERLDPVAAEALGLVHGQFGLLQQLFGAGPFGPARQSDRACQPDFRIGKADRRADDAAQELGKGSHLGDIGPRVEDDGKTVGVEPRKRVLRFQDTPQPPRDGQQHGVTRHDAIGFVDAAEIVEVDDEDGGPHVDLAADQRGQGVEPVQQQFAVG